MIICNLEGDELCMQTATSIAKRNYSIRFKNGTVYPLGRKYVKNGRFSRFEVAKMLTKLKKTEGEHYTIECDITYGDSDLAYFLMERQLRKIYSLTKCDLINIWLGPSNKSNFRFAAAKTVPYKSNRTEKPPIIEELREYLKNIKGAQEIEGHEADDALGMYQTDTSIAVHCDKDIFMIPGLHLNTMTDKITVVSDPGELHLSGKALKGTGIAFFYAQLLMGDPTDTIPSLARGYGPVTILKLFDGLTTEVEFQEAVVKEYKKQIGDGWEDRLKEQADLVWILRDQGIPGSKYLSGLGVFL